MKKTGSEILSAEDAPPGDEGPAEIIERAQLQADVARQRVRLAKDELRRARKRLKEAKREAKRARKYAALARKDWKRARRQAKKESVPEEPTAKARTTGRGGRPEAKLSDSRSSGRRRGTPRRRRTSRRRASK